MILVELAFGAVLALTVLLMLPFILMMAGIAGALMLWFMAPAIFIAVLVFWLIFPGHHGLALLLILVIGALLIHERSRHRMPTQP